jgi:hypothetical protein
VQLSQIFVAHLLQLTAEVFNQFGDEGAGAGGGIKDFHLLVDQGLAEVLLAQPVGTLDHKAHNLIRRVDDTEAVCLFLVVDLVEIFVDDLEEVLLFVVAGHECGGALDRRIVGTKLRQQVVFYLAGEKCVLQRIELLRHVVLW